MISNIFTSRIKDPHNKFEENIRGTTVVRNPTDIKQGWIN